MNMHYRLAVVIMFLAIAVPLDGAMAVDLYSCANDLDDLRRASDDANDAAEQARNAHDELENCIDYPETYDLYGDHCEDARLDYESALNNLKAIAQKYYRDNGVY